MTEILAKGQMALPLFDDDDPPAEFTELPMPEADKPPVTTPQDFSHLSPEERSVVGDPKDYDWENAIVPISQIPPTHHLVVGMGTLAAMSEEEFAEKLAIMQRGQDRIRTIMEKLLTKGEDYGLVKGIDRPFLHQPGAEKLSNFYGFAVRQEAERIIGQRATVTVGDLTSNTRMADPQYDARQWLSPPLAYHVRSYVHLGDFTGPVVAQGYGEASSWEEKYRYRWGKATCPKCGREGLIRGKPDGKLKGKWWCPGREGGCNSTFEPGSSEITSPGKVENTDPYSLAETLIQMAGKRSFVAAIRRATGTSGLFTQDEDSPSVNQQSAESGEDQPEATATVTNVEHSPILPGAKTEEATPQQIAQLKTLAMEKDLGPPQIAALLKRLGYKGDIPETGAGVSRVVKTLTAKQLGALLMVMDTGTLPSETESGTADDGPSFGAGTSSNEGRS